MQGKGVELAKPRQDHLPDGQAAVPSSHSESGKSTSLSMRRERILAADAIRALPKGAALRFATGMGAAMLELRPGYIELRADELSAAAARASKASPSGPSPRPPRSSPTSALLSAPWWWLTAALAI